MHSFAPIELSICYSNSKKEQTGQKKHVEDETYLRGYRIRIYL